ncbi:MAG: UDP-N-acetylmuramate dehydrogenase [Clostridia bacterium]|nr:UDP-N-acetylmuramate dehydrogenase [Clostridia bacterium]
MGVSLWYNVNECSIALQKAWIEVARDVPAREVSLLRAGGKLSLIAYPRNVTELITTINLAKEYDLPLFVLGGGSNLLVRDGGYQGAAVSLKHFKGSLIKKNHLFVGAHEKLPFLASMTARNSLAGLEPLCGIPCSIGGAVIKNAGCYGTEISDLVEAVTILDLNTLKVERINRNKIDYSYRSSGNALKNAIVLYVRLRLTPSCENLLEKISTYREKRLCSQPTEPSLGSVFLKTKDGVSAGYYIDKAKLKGTRIGGAEISTKHANFIINANGATATDYLKLCSLMHDVVYKKFKISLQKEIDIIGDDNRD